MEVLKNKRFRKKTQENSTSFQLTPLSVDVYYFPRSGLKVRGGVTRLPTPTPSCPFRSPLGILLSQGRIQDFEMGGEFCNNVREIKYDFNFWGIRKKKKERKKGAQKKGGENSPILPPLDPRLSAH